MQLCHKIVIYVVNLVYIAYIHILIAIVLQWAFIEGCPTKDFCEFALTELHTPV